MNTPPSLETVYQAINALYNNPDTSGKEKASVWLGELQRSVYAWKIADEVLRQKLDRESCYFAAQTMRTKIQYSFHELPTDSYFSLRDSLLEHLTHGTDDTASIIVTQLCLALADLTLQMPMWNDPVVDLIQRFGSNTQSLPVLLEILTVLPEEISRTSLRLGANRRLEVNNSFKRVSPQLIQLLGICIQHSCKEDLKLHIKVFRCLDSWFAAGVVHTDDPALHNLMAYLFQALMSPATVSMVHEAASDAVCSALATVEEIKMHGAFTQVLHQGVSMLLESYHMAVSQEDTDKAINYCHMFTDLASSLVEEMVASPGQGLGSLQTLDILLNCVGHHDYEVAEITFNVWYNLSEQLYRRNEENVSRVFEPYVQRLIVSLCRHCELDSDHEGIPDEKDDFSEFRQRVTSLLKDVVFLVGSDVCFRQMFENLKNQGLSATWAVTEASLFVMAAVAKSIIPEENVVVPEVIQCILTLQNDAHVSVRYTSTRLLGELCEWIEKHPQFLDPVLNYLLVCLQVSQLATVAASALQSICAACKGQMASQFQGLLRIVQMIDSIAIANDAAVELLKGAALILSQMPAEKITDGLRQMCRTQLVPLEEVIKETNGHKDGLKKDPTVWLDRLATIFRNMKLESVEGVEMHPCQPVVHEVWPVLSLACNKFQTDVRVVERCCRCIRFAIRCVGRQSAALLEPLVSQMVQLYQVHQHSCFLYLGSILVDEYGSEPGCIQGLLDMMQAFCGPTFRLLEGAHGMRNHPDTVDDLFRLCTRFLQRSPLLFLQSPVAKPILSCALAAATIDHKDANASVMKFFYDLIRTARLREDSTDNVPRQMCIKEMLRDHGQNLVDTLLQASIFCLSSYMLADVADVLFELLLLDKESFTKWQEEAIRRVPVQGAAGTVTVTPEQMADFHQTVLSAQRVKTITHALKDFSRLFR